MRTPRKIKSEEVAQFNELRQKNAGKLFSYYEMRELISFLKNTERMFSALLKNGCIEKVGKDYRFPKEPVHISKLQKVLEDIRQYKKTHAKKENNETSEEIAIELLKSLGYRVSKPSIDMDAALRNPNLTVSNFIRWINL